MSRASESGTTDSADTGNMASLSALKQAKRFETVLVGEGSASVVYPHYNVACSSAGIRKEQLWEIVKTGTPAGKLYAASALMVRDAAEGRKALERLSGEKAAVQFQSGCEVFNDKVDNIAASLLKTGRYMDFTLISQ
ncbi:MAG: hypothetical protein K2W95_22300 [Candidatus Obscuribacterales bacterium]|nr:hypothetical protein [Candidatus Obscuribacterales bacterium]